MMGDIPIIGIIYYILYISQFDSATIYLFFFNSRNRDVTFLVYWLSGAFSKNND